MWVMAARPNLSGSAGMPLCFIDRYGNKYTTAVATSDGDWWLRARILMLRDF
jgi:hypothetical protein